MDKQPTLDSGLTKSTRWVGLVELAKATTDVTLEELCELARTNPVFRRLSIQDGTHWPLERTLVILRGMLIGGEIPGKLWSGSVKHDALAEKRPNGPQCFVPCAPQCAVMCRDRTVPFELLSAKDAKLGAEMKNFIREFTEHITKGTEIVAKIRELVGDGFKGRGQAGHGSSSCREESGAAQKHTS